MSRPPSEEKTRSAARGPSVRSGPARSSDEVPLLAEIVGSVDVFDALTSARPYRVALTAEEAGKYLLLQAEVGKFCRRHVEAFLDTLGTAEICLAS